MLSAVDCRIGLDRGRRRPKEDEVLCLLFRIKLDGLPPRILTGASDFPFIRLDPDDDLQYGKIPGDKPLPFGNLL